MFLETIADSGCGYNARHHHMVILRFYYNFLADVEQRPWTCFVHTPLIRDVIHISYFDVT